MGASDLPPPESWLARARSLARSLAEEARPGPLSLDVQRLFALFPPERPLGEGLFRLTEALQRTPDREGRRALVREHVPGLRGRRRAALALPLVEAGLGAVGRKFVYAERIEDAVRRGARQARRDPRRLFSFDMLGEGARTAEDAARGLERYRRAIEASGADRRAFGVSIKLSSIHERFDAPAYARSRKEILARLLGLCTAAADRGVALSIDAEESERAPLQLDLLGELCSRAALREWEGLGTVVQAYGGGALELTERVIDLARRRCDVGGARLAVRLVKGAYWDAEVKRAQELGVERYPVFTAKPATDRAYVACASRLLASSRWVSPQIATHNPVTLGCVLAMAERGGGWDRLECQRLWGMGEGLDRALRSVAPQVPVRIYAPVGERRELLAYLVRRLLENGASTSFVRQAAGAADMESLLEGAFAALTGPEQAAASRIAPPQEILMPERRVARGLDLGHAETLAAFARDVEAVPRNWRAGPIIGGEPHGGPARTVRSPARPDVAIGEVVEASERVVADAVGIAFAHRRAWAQAAVERRAQALERLGELLEAQATELAALCVWEAGKTLADALADVREAIDFCRYYAQQARALFRPVPLRSPTGESNVLTLHGRGVFACISPWNFPVAIFTGQVAAALVAGNTVVAKPAEQTPLTACRIARLIHAAGIPREAFHLVTGPGETVGKALVEDPRIAGVVFTGSNPTAASIQRALAAKDGPIVPFIAETGGLNAMIVDSTALAEQVVDAVVASAFRSAGQRCSSLRMLYLQEEIAPQVEAMLRGAMASLRVGDPADPSTDIGPLIDAGARQDLARYVAAMRSAKRVVGEAPAASLPGYFLSPIAFSVGSIRELPGERFGPILHVARFALAELDGVLDAIDARGFGLTMGVHTRLASRAEHVRRRVAVGNLYVNRNIIGAVVGVQPFGGEGLSGTGPKAGGPHYLARFATERVFTINTAAAGGDLQLVTGAAS